MKSCCPRPLDASDCLPPSTRGFIASGYAARSLRAHSFDVCNTRPLITAAVVLAAALLAPSGASAQAGASSRAAVKAVTTTLVSSGAYKECFGLSAQQKLRYWYRAESAVDFNIQTVEGGATLYPVKKDKSAIGSGTFQPRIVAPATSQDYCVVWTNTAKRPVTLTFEFARVGG